MLDVRVVLTLLIQYSDITITGYFTSIAGEICIYAGFEAHMIAKYSKHKH